MLRKPSATSSLAICRVRAHHNALAATSRMSVRISLKNHDRFSGHIVGHGQFRRTCLASGSLDTMAAKHLVKA
jgi:hypothetical protein